MGEPFIFISLTYKMLSLGLSLKKSRNGCRSVISNLIMYCAFFGAPVILTDLANSILSNGMSISNEM